MGALNQHLNFNNPERIIEGWYWALRSSEVKRGKIKALHFLGRELVVYRGASGRLTAMDAYCPHMGAHFAEGSTEGDSIRCKFHYWKFSREGQCEDIPCQKSVAGVNPVHTWPVEEKYGMIWIWTGKKPTQPVPFVPELEDFDVEAKLGNRFVKGCHPNVMMINAIDAQHFNSVHRLAVPLDLQPEKQNGNWITFSNVTSVPKTNLILRTISRFYAGALTYILSYWFASTGSVTLGPDFLHFHIIFALRPTRDGKSEGQTILVTKQRKGILGRVTNSLILKFTEIVGNYFAKGDTQIFKSIRFNFATPIRADSSIIRFIQHAEGQKSVPWGFPENSHDVDLAQSAAHFESPAPRPSLIYEKEFM
jgi:phenylpropionate dioxygenase-like ring-hydroxylating dioxygenase large terminal subunit